MHTNDTNKILDELTSFPNEGIVRVSISNLISDIRWEVVSIINKRSLNLWKRRLSSIGWSAELYDKEFFLNLWAFDFEKNDSKFKIPVENVQSVLELIRPKIPDFIESWPDRELREELSEEILTWFQETPILTDDEVSKLTTFYTWTMFDSGYWMSKTRPILSLYIWRYFSLNWNKEILKKIFKSNIIHKISLKECEVGKTTKWIYIWSNVIAASDLIYE
ncbi:MAG: hypothetical protein ACD_3C00086G0065 [uncultured bacterium (gcode 4)]|uniref:Uncharacterized protein n=1 Tax=uncultured bacterium (gcode 4) TaxID=1234023 RepID=K2FAS5_9BACT|nr:MAG: hypothetical protein ACD_3C00086G0065 [uncultured bacterium (gcode 4)]